MKFTTYEIADAISCLHPVQNVDQLLEDLKKTSYKRKNIGWWNLCGQVMKGYSEKSIKFNVTKCYYTFLRHRAEVKNLLEIKFLNVNSSVDISKTEIIEENNLKEIELSGESVMINMEVEVSFQSNKIVEIDYEQKIRGENFFINSELSFDTLLENIWR